MTQLQQKALDEMMRQGLHIQKYAAGRCWQNQMQYQLDSEVSVPNSLKELISKTNWELERIYQQTTKIRMLIHRL